MPLRGPIDGHRGRAREAPQEALSADDVGRMTSEAALSKHPKGRGSRPITPQDEVSENDRSNPTFISNFEVCENHNRKQRNGRQGFNGGVVAGDFR